MIRGLEKWRLIDLLDLVVTSIFFSKPLKFVVFTTFYWRFVLHFTKMSNYVETSLFSSIKELTVILKYNCDNYMRAEQKCIVVR